MSSVDGFYAEARKIFFWLKKLPITFFTYFSMTRETGSYQAQTYLKVCRFVHRHSVEIRESIHCLAVFRLYFQEHVLKARLVKPLEHQVDHGDVDESFAGFSWRLVVFAQPAIAIKPREGPFHHPAMG